MHEDEALEAIGREWLIRIRSFSNRVQLRLIEKEVSFVVKTSRPTLSAALEYLKGFADE